ncbi:uncharacterized protein LOC108958845 [Eucalyptus grandis]|uniref:uncharacterized protein LOC108958845 n=1 Tax=Eucalyptus grandis TaxID=71139 RepID=UPI00192E94BA|nr:uncharacterized protein LOC108958845 [Eucalyptus grandis]
MSDWVAAFVIGLISHNQGNSYTHTTEVDGALQAFWASFLLLHLGGPDNITAFSLEDRSLWRRHLLSLTFQVTAVIYVFVQIFPNDKLMMIPTMLVFLAGVIKNAERLLALSLSSFPRIREWMLLSLRRLKNAKLPNNSSPNAWRELLGEEWLNELNGLGDGYSNGGEVKLAESIIVKHAYWFFQIFMFFLADLIFRKGECKMSREYFHKVSAADALRLISVELDFIYEMLHTKVLAIRSKMSYIFRFIAFTNIMVAFILFNRLKKHQLPKLDVVITYSLLFGGIAFDVIALFMLVFSDWTVAEIKWYNKGSSKLGTILHNMVFAMANLRKPQFTKCEAEPKATLEVRQSLEAMVRGSISMG